MPISPLIWAKLLGLCELQERIQSSLSLLNSSISSNPKLSLGSTKYACNNTRYTRYVYTRYVSIVLEYASNNNNETT